MMSDVKRKPGPPRKAEVVQKAYELGLGALEALAEETVATLNRKISEANTNYTENDVKSVKCGHNDFRTVRIISNGGNHLECHCNKCDCTWLAE